MAVVRGRASRRARAPARSSSHTGSAAPSSRAGDGAAQLRAADARRDRHRRLPAPRGRRGLRRVAVRRRLATTRPSRSRSARSPTRCTSSSTSATTSSRSARRSSRCSACCSPNGKRRSRGASRCGLSGRSLVGVTVVLSLAAPYVAQRKVDEAVAKRDPDLAAQAHAWNPVSILPLLTEAAIEEQLGDKREGAAALPSGGRDAAGESRRVGRARRCSSSTRGTTRARRTASLSDGVQARPVQPVRSPSDGGALDRARAKAVRSACG